MQCICVMKNLLYLCVVLPFFSDFDEQTADDWDVDMSVYYDKGILSLSCITLDNRRN